MDLRKFLPFVSPKTSEKVSETVFTPPVKDREKEVPPNRESLLVWKAPQFIKSNKSEEYTKRMISLLVLVGIVLILAGQFWTLVIIVSLFGLYRALETLPDVEAAHEIDNYGILYFGKQYYWQEFRYFFLTEKGGYKILNVDTYLQYPSRLIMVLPKTSEADEVIRILKEKMSFREEEPTTIFDRWIGKITKRLNLE